VALLLSEGGEEGGQEVRSLRRHGDGGSEDWREAWYDGGWTEKGVVRLLRAENGSSMISRPGLAELPSRSERCKVGAGKREEARRRRGRATGTRCLSKAPGRTAALGSEMGCEEGRTAMAAGRGDGGGLL
jgi:hypothetical protein